MEKLELDPIAIVFNALPANHRPMLFADVVALTGLDSGQVRALLNQLEEKGAARIEYGRGWQRIGVQNFGQVRSSFAIQSQLLNEQRVKARKENPNLTVFDTGEMLEPKVWPDKSGKVDFDNDESATDFVLMAYPSLLEEGTTVIEIDGLCAQRIKIIINDDTVYNEEIQ